MLSSASAVNSVLYFCSFQVSFEQFLQEAFLLMIHIIYSETGGQDLRAGTRTAGRQFPPLEREEAEGGVMPRLLRCTEPLPTPASLQRSRPPRLQPPQLG